MNSISLTQVSAIVVAVSLASFFVNADEALAKNMKDRVVTKTENYLAVVEVAAEESSDKFTFTSLDNDKNGKLSQKEVLAGRNQWLVKSFEKIDSNTDELLTEQELIDFVTRSTVITQ
jgi:methyltransferase-like protein